MLVRTSVATLGLAALLFAACDSPAEPPDAAVELELFSEAELSAAAMRAGGGPPLLEELASRIPSFVGLYFDRDCNLIVMVTDPADAGVARELLGPVHAARVENVRRCPDTATVIVVVTGDYTYRQLQAWMAEARPILRIRGVAGMRIDLRLNRIVVLVRARESARRARAALEELGLPVDAFVFRGVLARPARPGTGSESR